MEKDYVIISVESRKGGVGKTTAALNLAKRLKDFGYIVLFLDADITGTNTAEIVNNTFWKSSVAVLKQQEVPLNLLAEFKKKFMLNDFIRPFTTDKNDTNNITIDANKINVLGSQIYNLNGAQDKFTCNPSIIFDELHAFWFIEYISLICRQFFNLSFKGIPDKETQKNNEIPKEKYSVIIDNSPGYIGIAPILQELLTDLGPVKGKFLFVTSLDKQDLISCKHAINKLYDIYNNKNDVAALFNQEIPFSWKDEYKNFFNKMVENICPEINGGLEYYFKESKHRNNYINNPEKYISVLINKVPALIKSGDLEYDYETALNVNNNKSVFEDIICFQNNKVADDLLISYNDLFEYQYYQDSLLNSNLKNIDRDNIYKRFTNIFKDSKINLLKPPIDNSNDTEVIILYFKHFNSLKRVPQKLKEFFHNNGLHILLPLLENVLDFNDLIVDFEETLMEVLKQLKMSPYWGYRNGDYSELTNFYTGVYNKTFFLVKDHIIPDQNETPQVLATLSVYLSFILFPYINKRNSSEVKEIIIDLFSGVVLYSYLRYINEQKRNSEKLSLNTFLDMESSSQEESNELNYLIMRNHLTKIHLNSRTFLDLYKSVILPMSCVKAIQDDTDLLELIIGEIILQSNFDLSYISMIKDLLKSVLEKRSISHNEGLLQFKNIQTEAYKMKEFEDAINMILKNWEILHNGI